MKKTLIFGLGDSNLEIIKIFKEKNISFDIFDDNFDQEFLKNNPEINYIHSKKYNKEDVIKYKEIIKSPGIAPFHPLIFQAKKNNIKIKTEINYFLENFKGQVIAITGTNGKSSTAFLIYQLLKTNYDAHLVGNIGNIASKIIKTTNKKSLAILELSSFQLEYLKEFKYHTAIITNIKSDHLDWHLSFEKYKNAKENIKANLTINENLIIDFDDPELVEIAHKSMANVIPFSIKNKLYDNGCYILKDSIYFKNEKIISLEQIKQNPVQNIKNIMIAIIVAKKFKLKNETIINNLKKANNLEHRMEKVDNDFDLNIYNDSKSTNIDSTNFALQNIKNELILILGGFNKNLDYNELIITKNIKFIYAYGDIASKIKKTLNMKNIFIFESFEECINKALQKAIELKIDLLFSPSSSSFDTHKNFEERGKQFKKIIQKEN